MNPQLQNIFELLSSSDIVSSLQGIRRGVEKESLRISSDAKLSQAPHPVAFGSSFQHDMITTDFAESQMEFITPVGTDGEKTLQILADLHKYVTENIDNELLWPASMPCSIDNEEDIPLARYGNSNQGKMKTLYRQGLKNRYGSMMQVIAGVHYNFSMPDNFWPVWQRLKGDNQPLQDFISESYFGLIRNFIRLGWLIPYLFGASPAVDSTFLRNSRSKLPLKEFGTASLYLPYATSLRVSDLGYNSKEQDNLDISYNGLTQFIDGLRQAVSTSNPVFEKIGIKKKSQFQQINSNTLQEEGELYGIIRPKRVPKDGESLSDALEARGVQYVEVRSLDVNPYDPTGLSLEQIYFLDIFLTYCLLTDSPALSFEEQKNTQKNVNLVASCGRKKSLMLMDGDRKKSLICWAKDIFTDLEKVAELLDKAHSGITEDAKKVYTRAVQCQIQKLHNPERTPSARILKDMLENKQEISDLFLSLAKSHRQTFLAADYQQLRRTELDNMVLQSIAQQQLIESQDTVDFESYFKMVKGENPHDLSGSAKSKKQSSDNWQDSSTENSPCKCV